MRSFSFLFPGAEGIGVLLALRPGRDGASGEGTRSSKPPSLSAPGREVGSTGVVVFPSNLI